MASFNQATLIGFVGKDPQSIQTRTGKMMVSFSLATTDKGYTRQDGTSVPDATEWHNVVFFGKLAEIIMQYVRKGSSLFIQGKLRTRSYEDNQTRQRRYVTEIIGENFQLLDRKQDAQQSQQTYQQQQQPGTQSVSTNPIGYAQIDANDMPF